ncbi:MAG: hypothetical protein AB4062_10995 [Crocosphaera sp.]
MSSRSHITIEEIWICPPLAFARFGQSPYPMENFHWAENDYSPRGTAETVIEPALTFNIDPNGNISAYLPEEIRFRDGEKWRPVCPFFELHGRLSDGSEGPIGLPELHSAGLTLKDIVWQITVANRKAYHYTLAEGDFVEASVTISGEDYRIHPLLGKSPQNVENPIVPEGMYIPLGHLRVIRPNPSWPEVRLRVTPPQGLIYAPTNTSERDLSALVPATQNKEEFLRHINMMLNPDAAWANWQLENDPRTNPGGLYAQDGQGHSLGFLDDSNDGLIEVSIKGQGVANGQLTAYARYTCCPPDFQPDRRPFVSIADGLSDLTKREEVLRRGYIDGANWPETEDEIADLMQRVRETMEASNLDQQNLRSQLANSDNSIPFEPMAPRPGHPLPLTELGRSNHARFLAYEVFKQRLGQRPELFEQWIRNPSNEPAAYNKKMPTVMRGSDSSPMSISQRQYYLMKEWLDVVQNNPDE